MEDAATLDEQVSRFFEWLGHFEAGVHQLGGGAQRYTCDQMEARVRYSWFKASAAGLPSLCLADIAIADSGRGFAFLARVARRFSRLSHGLQAQVLYVEQPAGLALRTWLANNGFGVCAAPGEQHHSWYLKRAHGVVDIGMRAAAPSTALELAALRLGSLGGAAARTRSSAPRRLPVRFAAAARCAPCA